MSREIVSSRQPTEADWLKCAEIMREHGRTFFFASRCLPPKRRRAVLATYAFCRMADDIVDRAQSSGPGAVADALNRWEGQINRPENPVAVAFAATRAEYGVPTQPVYDLLTGMRMDLTPSRYANWSELRAYCYYVAGTVGLMVAPILGCRDQAAMRYAANLGIAMQLTNILRDVAEDAEVNRLYLPLDELAAFGCDPEDILRGRPGERFPELIAFQVNRARALYDESMCGMRALIPSGRFTTLAASRLYAGILSEIEAMNYDVFQTRAHVSTSRKVRALPGVAATFVRLSLFSGSTARCQSTCVGDPHGDSIATPSWSEFRSYG